MLAAISLNEENAKEAFRHHPDMAEYPHTSDFEKIENDLNAFNYKSEWICDRITVLKRNPKKGTYKIIEEILLQ